MLQRIQAHLETQQPTTKLTAKNIEIKNSINLAPPPSVLSTDHQISCCRLQPYFSLHGPHRRAGSCSIGIGRRQEMGVILISMVIAWGELATSEMRRSCREDETWTLRGAYSVVSVFGDVASKSNLTPDVSGFYYHFVPTSLCQNQYSNTQHNSVSKSSGSFGRHTSTQRRFASNSDAMSRVSASHDPSPPSEPALVTCLPYPFCEKQDLSHVHPLVHRSRRFDLRSRLFMAMIISGTLHRSFPHPTSVCITVYSSGTSGVW